MTWETLIAVFFAWTIVGGIICVAFAGKSHADGWELCNPYWVYQYNRHVNWFGAIFLALLYNLACPFGAICYWFYKLCTVGGIKMWSKSVELLNPWESISGESIQPLKPNVELSFDAYDGDYDFLVYYRRAKPLNRFQIWMFKVCFGIRARNI